MTSADQAGEIQMAIINGASQRKLIQSSSPFLRNTR